MGVMHEELVNKILEEASRRQSDPQTRGFHSEALRESKIILTCPVTIHTRVCEDAWDFILRKET